MLGEFDPLSASVALIQKPVNWFASQLTGFYMRATLAINGLSELINFYFQEE